MELDELKSAWQSLNQQLERKFALDFNSFKQDRLTRLRSGLWPMRFGQIIRILFGIVLMLVAVPVWVVHWPQPLLVCSGLAVHVYGILECITGARILWLIGAIDYTAPVLAIQKQLSQLRTSYLRSSFWLGNAWWIMWIPLMVIATVWTNPWITDADWYGSRPLQFVLISTLIGTVGILIFVAVVLVWRKRNPDLLRKLEDQSSRGIAQARGILDEITEFEKV